MIRIDVNLRNRVDASASIDLHLSASVVWGQMRDIAHFLTIDPLHFRVRGDRKKNQGDKESANDRQHITSNPVGTGLVIEHRFLGIGPDRRSRILRWKEGEGYAVSDLSRLGNQCGFPHVCVYEINTNSVTTSRLLVSVRGKWTATWMPRWATRLWLWWVLKSTATHITRHFELFELILRRRGIMLPTSSSVSMEQGN